MRGLVLAPRSSVPEDVLEWLRQLDRTAPELIVSYRHPERDCFVVEPTPAADAAFPEPVRRWLERAAARGVLILICPED